MGESRAPKARLLRMRESFRIPAKVVQPAMPEMRLRLRFIRHYVRSGAFFLPFSPSLLK